MNAWQKQQLPHWLSTGNGQRQFTADFFAAHINIISAQTSFLMIPVLAIEAIASHPDFKPLVSVDGINIDLRYASPNNFVGRDLYSPLDCAWLHQHSAAGLERAVAWLKTEYPDYAFLVLDAVRPQRVQEMLWASLQGTDLMMYLADPARGSIHSFGMALDITIVDAGGKELDMGTPFDDLSERSQPKFEVEMLAKNKITQHQINHRTILRNAMKYGGFSGISTEWWHFDYGNRNQVREKYTRIL